MWSEADAICLGVDRGDRVVAAAFRRADPTGLVELGRRPLASGEVAAWVGRRESEAHAAGRHIRWVWSSTATWYPRLLDAGVRVERCTDLRLCRAILSSALDDALPPLPVWDAPHEEPAPAALFDVVPDGAARAEEIDETAAEYARQERVAVSSGLRLLLAAESAGSLAAAEMTSAGLPWNRGGHEQILVSELGERTAAGRPRLIEERAREVRAALDDETASLDSQPKLLRALHRAGVAAESTSKWELAEHDHPAIAPLLDYKRMMRLYTANGWGWLDEWVVDGRFRPTYVVGGVVTGRWASSGGGALQIPRLLRPAVRADPGWAIVDADVAQLEPRVLAAMAHDRAMAAAAAGRDLYDGVVSAGVAATRSEAKYAVLGALYGSTTGDAARLMPRLRRAFPRAVGLTDDAALAGERGERVSTMLGRTSPAPGPRWEAMQQRANASAADERSARSAARERGRFTRNFVVQGTAAEWALAWMADLRTRLAAFPPSEVPAPRSGPAFARRPHLAFFLHDEVIVHAPADQAEAAAEAVRESAARAGRLLFGEFPIDFPLDIRIGPSAAE
ncbi:bifunctional 3'-5' exonuclease/DNA polymerase [Microbacterium halophytorum]|uniref:bifunctional 3'-5' exonuclease/DNA polymerase n=1 Tax=Microbacterium halophytorum TaxID=2067568 RepID=UPI001319C256|nr:bifunctional 3'-5' exonuclease/DNA polymerase [Microbacterium halophytorum]